MAKPTRARVLAYIDHFWRMYHYAPTLREIACALNLGSMETVRYHVRQLAAAGWIAWTPGSTRTIRRVR